MTTPPAALPLAKPGDWFYNAPVSFGADPEYFLLDKEGKVVESSVLLPTPRVKSKNNYADITRDGVQIEFNPLSSFCRASFSTYFQQAVLDTADMAKAKGLSLSFNPTVKLTKAQWNKLSPEAQALGCSPSANVYPDVKPLDAVTKGKPVLLRSAGGHIHLGIGLYDSPTRLVKILDAVVGNTCVLLDRDPNAARRRRYYGRAGEYRVKPYGIEYRVLSNFWTQWYPVMSLVLQLCRIASSMWVGSTNGYPDTQSFVRKDYSSKLFELVEEKQIAKAINKNDFDLALKNFEKIAKYVGETYRASMDCPFRGSQLEALKMLIGRGIPYYMKMSPVDHWKKRGTDGHFNGWETWSKQTVPY